MAVGETSRGVKLHSSRDAVSEHDYRYSTSQKPPVGIHISARRHRTIGATGKRPPVPQGKGVKGKGKRAMVVRETTETINLDRSSDLGRAMSLSVRIWLQSTSLSTMCLQILCGAD
jgi:hypothetical protein